MAPKKSVEDIFAEYTEALLEDRPPDIKADIAALDPKEQQELLTLCATLHDLKAAYHDVPESRFIKEMRRWIAEDAVARNPRQYLREHLGTHEQPDLPHPPKDISKHTDEH